MKRDLLLSGLRQVVGDTSTTERGSTFLVRVESVRGLAALMVTLLHAWLIVGGQWDTWLADFPPVHSIQSFTTKLLLTLFNGQAAVTMFFVISGFVLGLSLDRGKSAFLQNGITFFVRRIFRIYPAHVLVVLCTAGFLLVHQVVPDSKGSGWFNHLYHEPLSLGMIGGNLLLASFTMNPAAWTLTVEIVASLVLPVLHFMNRRVSPLLDLGVLALLVVISYEFRDVVTLRWLFAFYLGLMIPSWGRMLAEATKSSPRLAAMMVSSTLCTFWFVRTVFHAHGTGGSPAVEYTEAVAAAMLVAFMIYGADLRCYRLLDLPIVRFYGRISYSFYLWHVLVLYIISSTLFTYIPEGLVLRYPVPMSAAISVGALALVTAIAALSYVCVEKPCIAWGRDLTKSIRPRLYATAG